MRVQLLAGCIAALGAAGCAGAAGAAPVQSAEAPISVRVESWGKLLTAWEIQPDGSGVHRSAVAVGGGFRDYDVVTKRFATGREGYASVRRLLDPAKRYSGKALPCGRSVTDAPYGSVAWGAAPAGRLDFNFGCLGKKAVRVNAQIEAATDMVSGWAAAAPEAGREQVRSRK
jgi:hypothetical protein